MAYSGAATASYPRVKCGQQLISGLGAFRAPKVGWDVLGVEKTQDYELCSRRRLHPVELSANKSRARRFASVLQFASSSDELYAVIKKRHAPAADESATRGVSPPRDSAH